jgi:Glycosyl hydrolase family 65, C-terminal domain
MASLGSGFRHPHAAVAGFGGLRDHDGNLTFAPRLPPRLERLTFRILFRGRRLKVEFGRTEATYTLLAGPPLLITDHGNPVEIKAEAALTKPIPAAPVRAARTQPNGREPARRESASPTRWHKPSAITCRRREGQVMWPQNREERSPAGALPEKGSCSRDRSNARDGARVVQRSSTA